MIRVGLTGGIACGKSTVAEMFATMGARVIQADKIAHELYQPGTAVYDEVVQHFGKEILQEDGLINRTRLGAVAFGQNRIEELNKIVHPGVLRRQEQLMNEIAVREPNVVVVVEAALIFEAGAQGQFAKMVVVTCRPEQKVARYALRAGVDESSARLEVNSRSKAQMPDADKIRRADYVIDNSGPLDRTRQQAARIYAELKVMALSRQ